MSKQILASFLLTTFLIAMAFSAKAIPNIGNFSVDLNSMIVDSPNISEDFIDEYDSIEMEITENVDETALDPSDTRLFAVLDNRLQTFEHVYEPMISREDLKLTLQEYKDFRISGIRNDISGVAEQNDEIGVLEDDINAYKTELEAQLAVMLKIRKETQARELANLRADITDFSTYYIAKRSNKANCPVVVSDTKAVEVIIENKAEFNAVKNDIEDKQDNLLAKLGESDNPEEDSLVAAKKEVIIKTIKDDQDNLNAKLDDLESQKEDIAKLSVKLDYIKIDKTETENMDEEQKEVSSSSTLSEKEKTEIDLMTQVEREDLEIEKEAELSEAVLKYNSDQKEVQEDLRSSISNLTTFTISK